MRTIPTLLIIISVLFVMFFLAIINTINSRDEIEQIQIEQKNIANECSELFLPISFNGVITGFAISDIRSCTIAILQIKNIEGDTHALKKCPFVEIKNNNLILYIRHENIIDYNGNENILIGSNLIKKKYSNQILVFNENNFLIYKFPVEKSLGNFIGP